MCCRSIVCSSCGGAYAGFASSNDHHSAGTPDVSCETGKCDGYLQSLTCKRQTGVTRPCRMCLAWCSSSSSSSCHIASQFSPVRSLSSSGPSRSTVPSCHSTQHGRVTGPHQSEGETNHTRQGVLHTLIVMSLHCFAEGGRNILQPVNRAETVYFPALTSPARPGLRVSSKRRDSDS